MREFKEYFPDVSKVNDEVRQEKKLSSFVTVVSLSEWLGECSNLQTNAIGFVYHDPPSLLYNLFQSMVEAIHQTKDADELTIKARIKYFVEEEQEYIYGVLNDNFGEDDSSIEDMRSDIMEAVHSFYDVYVETIFRFIRDRFNINKKFDDNHYEFLFEKLSSENYAIKVTWSE